MSEPANRALQAGGGSEDEDEESQVEGTFSVAEVEAAEEPGAQPLEGAEAMEEVEEAAESGRKRARTSSLADDFKCIISQELLVEPVAAADGRLYEREQWESLVRQYPDKDTVKSPYSQMEISKIAYPMPQVKSGLATAVDNGAINGAEAEEWRVATAKKDLQREASRGNARSMGKLGWNYLKGKNGFEKDLPKGIELIRKGTAAGDVSSMAFLGSANLFGVGCITNWSTGILYTTLAAANGSEFAAEVLGSALIHGKHGFPTTQMKSEGIKWLQRIEDGDCAHKDLCADSKEKAMKKLHDLVVDVSET